MSMNINNIVAIEFVNTFVFLTEKKVESNFWREFRSKSVLQIVSSLLNIYLFIQKVLQLHIYMCRI